MEKKDPSNVSIKNDKGEYEPLQPKHFTGKNGEREFSNLLIRNPEVFPKKWYEPEGSNWIPISVEVKLDAGYVDILGIDDAGGIYIIESKLDSNSSGKKTVRQQVTEYTYALLELAKKTSGWEKFCDKIKTANEGEICKEQNYVFRNQNLEEIIENNWKENSERCLKGIENNFKNGNYTLVIAIDIIPKNLRTSIDGQNEIDAEHRIPVFALEMNEFPIKPNEKIVVTSTYPYNLTEIKEKKHAAKGEVCDKEVFERRFAITAKTWKDEQRRKFNEVRKVIEKPAREIFYGANPNNPIIYPYYDTLADGDRAPVSLGSDGCFQFKLDALYGYVKNTGPGQPTKESEVWEKQISSIPELKKFYEKRGPGSYLKPEEWMPVHEEIIKILKVLIA